MIVSLQHGLWPVDPTIQYLKWCWLYANWTPMNKLEWIFLSKLKHFIQDSAFENVNNKMLASSKYPHFSSKVITVYIHWNRNVIMLKIFLIGSMESCNFANFSCSQWQKIPPTLLFCFNAKDLSAEFGHLLVGPCTAQLGATKLFVLNSKQSSVLICDTMGHHIMIHKSYTGTWRFLSSNWGLQWDY